MKLPLKTLIVEDNFIYLSELKRNFEPFKELIYIDTIAMTFDTAVQFLQHEKQEFDLSILDINLGNHDCYELIDLVGQHALGLIAFNTVEESIPFKRANELRKFLWIPKPYSPKGMEEFILDLLQNLEDLKNSPVQIAQNVFNIPTKDYDRRDSVNSCYTIKDKGSHFKIPFSEIWFIRGMEEYSKLYCKDEKGAQEIFLVRGALNDILEKLDQDLFKRCHRSYIVNTKKIKRCKLDHEGGFLYFNTYKDETGFTENIDGIERKIELRFSSHFRPWLAENKF